MLTELTPGMRFQDYQGRKLTITRTLEGQTYYLLDGDTGDCHLRTSVLLDVLNRPECRRLPEEETNDG